MESNKQGILSENVDSELLVIIGRKACEPAMIQEAWAELFRRHSGYLFRVCRRVASSGWRFELRLAEQFAEDAVYEVFRHVYEHAAERFVPRDVVNADEDRKHVRAWLGCVARRVSQDVLRDQSFRNEPNVDASFLEGSPGRGDRNQPTLNSTNTVRQILDSVLDDDEREIVLLRMQWYDPEKPNSHLPTEALDELSKRLDKKKDCIRKTYDRARKKLEEALRQAGLINRMVGPT